MKKVFRPFWSYDVLKTERWLNEMSAGGFHLNGINFDTRVFTFEESSPRTVFYRVMYQKKSDESILKGILDGGWEAVQTNGHFSVLRTEHPAGKIMPSYSGILDKNTGLKFWVGIVLLIITIFIAVLFFPIIIIILLMQLPSIDSGYATEDPASVPVGIDIVFASLMVLFDVLLLLGFVWLIYTYFTLKRTNKFLSKLCGDRLQLDFTLPRQTMLPPSVESTLMKSRQMFKRTRIAWAYAPDKVEKWLRKMAQQGNILYRMSHLGNGFYFTKAQSRRIKYVVDYQPKRSPDYYNAYQDAGWRLVFTSVTSRQGFAIWSYDYTESGLEPMFYCDMAAKIKNAKKFALTYSLCFFPVCLLYLAMIIMELLMPRENTDCFILIIWSILFLEFCFFATRTILYYFRVKKSSEL